MKKLKTQIKNINFISNPIFKYKLIKNISLSLISLIIFFTIAEISTRLFWHPVNYKPHEGIILKGNNRTYIHEGIKYTTNSFGIRNKELSLEKNSNTVRILSLGDSFIWGDGLEDDELITVKLEDELKGKFPKNIEVINTGISGFNTKDEYNQLVRLFPYYKPDLIILFFFTNDILATDSSNQIRSWKVNLNDFFRENSEFYSLLYYTIKNFLSLNSGTPSLFLPSDYFDINDSKPGWVAFKHYFLKIRDYCNSKNIKLLFVSIPTFTNLDSNYPYKELRFKVSKFISNTKTPFIDLFHLFTNYSASEFWVNERNKHWNGKATSLAAEELSDIIIKNDLLSIVHQ